MNCENERMTVSSLIANLTWSCAQPLQSSIICKCLVSCLKLFFSLSSCGRGGQQEQGWRQVGVLHALCQLLVNAQSILCASNLYPLHVYS